MRDPARRAALLAEIGYLVRRLFPLLLELGLHDEPLPLADQELLEVVERHPELKHV